MNAAESTLWQRLCTTRMRDVLRGRIDGRLDWRRVVAAADLPGEAAEVIEQVVRRSRLWRSEKVDVAQELIAHFQDGLEAGRSPQQLVDSFGDPVQAAQLIRRAKKRGRSLVWQMWRWACWSLAALAVFYAATVIYLFMGQPSISTDYLAIINERAEAVPEDQRAWPLYREALAKMNNLNPEPKWSRENDLGPSDEAWPEAASWLTNHADALALIRLAASRPEMGMPAYASYESYPLEDRRVFLAESDKRLQQMDRKKVPLEDRWLMATLLPHLQCLRDMARLLADDARRAALAGDGQTSYADVVAMLEISHHCQEQPFIVNAFVALAVQRLAFARIQGVLSDNSTVWSNDQLRNLAHRIAAAKIDWQSAFAGECYSFHDFVQRIYTDDGHGNGRITDEGLRALHTIAHQTDIDKATGLKSWRMQFGELATDAVAPASLYIMASRGELVAMYDRFIDEHLAALGRPLWERKAESDSVEQRIDGWSTFERTRYLPITLWMPSLSSMRKSIEAGRGERDGVLVGIAIELYHRDHSSWPKSLPELAPRYLPQMPVDRITGEPLHYKVVDDRPLVYSVGADGDDDAGSVPREDDGKPNSYLASPANMFGTPIDGDWVIWSTVESEGARNEDRGLRNEDGGM